MSITTSSPNKRPALVLDNQTEVEFLLTALELYKQGHILEKYKTNWGQLENIIVELKKCFEMFKPKEDATAYQKKPAETRKEYIKKIQGTEHLKK